MLESTNIFITGTMAPPESEALDEVRQEIAATKADLAEAKAEGDRELILMYGNLLAGLQEEKNRLMQAAG